MSAKAQHAAVLVFALSAAALAGCAPSPSHPIEPEGNPVPGDIEGKRSPPAVRRAVREGFPLFQGCFDEGLKRNHELGGRVVVKFTITADGRVTDAADGGSRMADPRVVACVIKGFEGLRFGASSAGPVPVVYPIEFSPD